MANCIQCGRELPGIVFGKRLCKWCVQYQAQQRGEIAEDAKQPVMDMPWERRASGPLVTHAIFGINVAVFLGMALAGVDIMNPASGQLMHWGSNATSLTLTGQWWRLITYNFVHIGILHIALNMWCFWNLGELAESLYGHTMFALVYLVCGVGGGVASLAWHQSVNSAGASGAIFGIAGALIASLKLGNFSLPQAHVKATLSSIVTFAVYNIVFGALTGFTDNAAHIGGLLTGMMLGGLIAIAAPARNQFVRRAAVLVLVSAVVGGGAAWTYKSKAYVIHVQRAQSMLGENKSEQAISELQTVLRMRPNYIPARLQLAYLYTRRAHFEEAEAEIRRVLQQDPQNQDALSQLSFVYTRSQQIPKAKETSAQLLRINPRSAEAHDGLGDALLAEKDYTGALGEYLQAARLDPDYEDNYSIGVCYARLKRYDEAIAQFKKHIATFGDGMDVEVELSKAYRAKGMTKEADEAMQKTMSFDLDRKTEATP